MDGHSLPIGPQPTVNPSVLPLKDFNLTRAGSGSYGLPSNLLTQAIDGMEGFMWYGRVDSTGAVLPSWLAVDPYRGTVSAMHVSYEGTEEETALTRVTLPKAAGHRL